jgi:hypothetical protein
MGTLYGRSDNTDLLTFAQAAERLGVGVLTIRQWVRTEQCPVVGDVRNHPEIQVLQRFSVSVFAQYSAIHASHGMP